VVNIIDGDTLKLIIYRRPEDLGDLSRLKLTKKQRKQTVPVLYTCRINGIDAAEKNTPQGQMAKRLLEEKLKVQRVNLWVTVFPQKEKYGRTLISLHADATTSKCIYDDLIGTPFGDLGILIERYDGGKKSDYMKQLPTIRVVVRT
jgi:hypothetical protein